MCSIGDDIYDHEEEKTIPVTKSLKLFDLCNKCRSEKPRLVLRTKDAYCNNCFLSSTVHKFKAYLGKSHLIQKNDRVLVWHQIGHPSTSLLHFLRSGLDLSSSKKLQFVPIILFIDDQYHLNLNERLNLLQKAKQEILSFGFRFNTVSFADYATNPKNLNKLFFIDIPQISELDKQKLEDVINKKTSKTHANDIKVLIRRQLLTDAAKYYQCKFVFTPEISVEVASSLLSNMSLGRGPHVAIDVGFCDDRDVDVKIIRPLRQFDMKELAFYNKINNLEPLSVRQKSVNPYLSVQDLMKKFVTDLQSNYPATVNTILRIGDKLSVDRDCERLCSLCKGPLSVINDQLTSHQSTTFSHLVSTEKHDYTISRQDWYQNIFNVFDERVVDKENLCYACSNISDNVKFT
ncbi:cytoplasmic tRNA 2-thiolation protein 2 [Diorhabda carinulata]|uniref:cytoplasmic tRNA 2-thiolation protein 2 n=1 Tax=Diorhabda carinulata TaxID=1163345 RepID=UPI0025A02505|nr:cytoplasmic tRNA 2-thiolation protein 2 [Diorhabda carinulata]